MKTKNLGLRVAGGLLLIITAFHLFRLIVGFGLIVAGHPVPLWINGIVTIVSGALAVWLFYLCD